MFTSTKCPKEALPWREEEVKVRDEVIHARSYSFRDHAASCKRTWIPQSDDKSVDDVNFGQLAT